MPVTPITISAEEFECAGYTEIVSQDNDGEVILRNENGGLELFAVCDSYAGWCVYCEDGRVLEFCRSIRE